MRKVSYRRNLGISSRERKRPQDLEVAGLKGTKDSGKEVNTYRRFPLRNKGTGEGKANAKYGHKHK